MSKGVEVRLDTSILDMMVANLDMKMERIITRMAFEVERDAKMLTPVDTGALRNSIYTVTRDSGASSFQRAVKIGKRSQATAFRRNKKGEILGMSTRKTKKGTKLARLANVRYSALPEPTGKTIAVVGTGIEYAQWVEWGTSRRAAHPFLKPAVVKVTRKFNKGETWRELVKAGK
jgi:HK97 gp10 family phage protein